MNEWFGAAVQDVLDGMRDLWDNTVGAVVNGLGDFLSWVGEMISIGESFSYGIVDEFVESFGILALGFGVAAKNIAADPIGTIHIALDSIGMVDPTGIADALNAGLYALEADADRQGIGQRLARNRREHQRVPASAASYCAVGSEYHWYRCRRGRGL